MQPPFKLPPLVATLANSRAQPPHGDSRAELAELSRWLEVEKQEELRLFREKILLRPLDQRRREGDTWYPVEVSRVGYVSGDHLKIWLAKSPPDNRRHGFTPGSMVSVFGNAGGKASENPQLHGVVAKVSRDEMQVVLSREDLPGWFGEYKLGTDRYFDETTYREMFRALNRCQAAESGGQPDRLAELREVLLGYQPAQFQEKVPRPEPSGAAEGLNVPQQAAVAHVLRAKDAAVIHGPPGTGKTTTLAAAIQASLQYERQVLVCAPSNTAVDVLCERLHAMDIPVLRLGHPVRVSEELQALTLDHQFDQHPEHAIYKRLRRQAEEQRNQALKFKRQYQRGQRKRELKDADDLKREAHLLERRMLAELIDRSRVIATTLAGANAPVLGNRQFSTVFMDEAAQAMPPAALIPLLRAERLILAGDHCQLPPTVKSFEAARAGLGESIFEKFLTRQAAMHGQNVGRLLTRQYRMHEQIMAFSNRQFYGGELVADETVRTHVLAPGAEAPLLNEPLAWIDTAGCGFAEEQDAETLSRFNPGEAQFVLAWLAAFFAGLDEHVLEPVRIGLLAPYRAQVSLLREEAQARGLAAASTHRLTIDTVDGFQGQEQDGIVVSLVRSNEQGEVGFLGDVRRMNVAMTRARKKLVLIGDSATVAQNAFFAELLDDFQAADRYGTAWSYPELMAT